MTTVVETPVVLKDLRDNVVNLQNLLRNGKITDLPEQYVWSEKMKDNLVSADPAEKVAVDCNDEHLLPVIDISCLRAEEENADLVKKVVREIGDAAKTWGFFQIVNHGIPEELMKECNQFSRNFFGLPVEIKEKLHCDDGTGYNGRLSQLKNHVPWYEYLAGRDNRVEHYTKLLWPEGNPLTSQALAVEDYWQKMKHLGVMLIEVLAKYLNLEPTTFSHVFKNPDNHFRGTLEQWTNRSGWRINHYPVTPRPDQTIGLGPHADPNVLTLLQQDDVGGLEVRKGNQWIPVSPVPGGLIINIGDCLEAWSNGIYRSVEHRVLTSEKVDRHSGAFFIAPAGSQQIQAPPELIDDGHPEVFKPYIYGEYLLLIFSNRIIGKTGLDFVRIQSPAAHE